MDGVADCGVIMGRTEFCGNPATLKSNLEKGALDLNLASQTLAVSTRTDGNLGAAIDCASNNHLVKWERRVLGRTWNSQRMVGERGNQRPQALKGRAWNLSENHEPLRRSCGSLGFLVGAH